MNFKLALFYLLVLYPCKSHGTNQTTEVDVLILGAGISGLTAANHLNNNGIGKYLVLEAQDYVGGRLKNLSFGGITVGEGANWVHFIEDGDDNPILQLTKKLKLKQHTQDVFDIAIKNAPGGMVAFNATLKAFEDAAEKIANDNVNMPHREDQPFRSALAGKGWRADTGLKSAVEWFICDFEYAVKVDMISTRHIGLPESNAFVTDPRGYATLASYFAKNVTDKIKIGTVVTEIKYDSKGAQIKTKNGHSYKAKYVLCTFSNGVLGSDLVKFNPELPSWKGKAINKIPMAYYTHIFVKFPTVFWDDKTFILNAEEIYEAYPLIFNLNAKGFHQGSNVLLFTVIDDDSLRVENQPENVTIEEVLVSLKKMYPTRNISRPTEIFVSKWSKNPYTRGSFNNAVVGSSMIDFHNLEGRIDSVFFAGEGCDGDYFGSLQGAYNTGLRQTKVIISCLKGKDCALYQPEETDRCVVAAAVMSGGIIDFILLCFISLPFLAF